MPYTFSSNYWEIYPYCCKLAEALLEYGKGNNERALALLGPDFDANHYKVISEITSIWLHKSLS